MLAGGVSFFGGWRSKNVFTAFSFYLPAVQGNAGVLESSLIVLVAVFICTVAATAAIGTFLTCAKKNYTRLSRKLAS